MFDITSLQKDVHAVYCKMIQCLCSAVMVYGRASVYIGEFV